MTDDWLLVPMANRLPRDLCVTKTLWMIGLNVGGHKTRLGRRAAFVVILLVVLCVRLFVLRISRGLC